MSSSLLSPALNPLFTLHQSALHPRKSDHMDHMHFGLLRPLISTWICPITSLNRRLEGVKSEIRVFSPYSPPHPRKFALGQLCPSMEEHCSFKEAHSRQLSLLLNSGYFSLSLSNQPRSGNSSAAACPGFLDHPL